MSISSFKRLPHNKVALKSTNLKSSVFNFNHVDSVGNKMFVANKRVFNIVCHWTFPLSGGLTKATITQNRVNPRSPQHFIWWQFVIRDFLFLIFWIETTFYRTTSVAHFLLVTSTTCLFLLFVKRMLYVSLRKCAPWISFFTLLPGFKCVICFDSIHTQSIFYPFSWVKLELTKYQLTKIMTILLPHGRFPSMILVDYRCGFTCVVRDIYQLKDLECIENISHHQLQMAFLNQWLSRTKFLTNWFTIAGHNHGC